MEHQRHVLAAYKAFADQTKGSVNYTNRNHWQRILHENKHAVTVCIHEIHESSGAYTSQFIAPSLGGDFRPSYAKTVKSFYAGCLPLRGPQQMSDVNPHEVDQ